MESRIGKARQKLRQKNLSSAIITNPTNIFFLTGFTGVSPAERESILILADKNTLIVPRLYQKEASNLKSKNLEIRVVAERNQMFKFATDLLKKSKRVGFEESDLTYKEYRDLGSNPKMSPTLIATTNLIEDLRIIKSEDEIKKIAKAQEISQRAFAAIIKTIKIGQTEEEIADRLAKVIKSQSPQGLAFESIIASGPNSGKPHHKTGNRKIKKGDVLLLDFGAKYQNYLGDLSRTVIIGRAGDREKNIYSHVQNAQKKALAKITINTPAVQVFHVAHNHFKKHRLSEFFIHGLGHGIGLEVHEEPYLRQSPIGGRLLKNGMVFSVEPGLYFPWGGIRIEDLVTVTNGTAKVLGKLSKEELVEIT